MEEMIFKRECFVCGIMYTVITEIATSNNIYCKKIIYSIVRAYFHKVPHNEIVNLVSQPSVLIYSTT